jgi:hypothetical protein
VLFAAPLDAPTRPPAMWIAQEFGADGLQCHPVAQLYILRLVRLPYSAFDFFGYGGIVRRCGEAAGRSAADFSHRGLKQSIDRLPFLRHQFNRLLPFELGAGVEADCAQRMCAGTLPWVHRGNSPASRMQPGHPVAG